MRIVRTLLGIAALHVVVAEASAGGQATVAPLPENRIPPVIATPIRMGSSGAPLYAVGHRLSIPGRWRQVHLHPAGEILLFELESGKKDQALLAYDHHAQKIRWARLVRDMTLRLRDDVCILESKDSLVVLSLESGEELWRSAGKAIPSAHPDVIIVGKEKNSSSSPSSAATSELYPGGSQKGQDRGVVLSGRDVHTGAIRWERVAKLSEGIEWSTCLGAWCYYKAPDGLEAVDLATGEGWFLAAKSSSPNVGSQLGALFTLNLAGLVMPDRFHHMGSTPLIMDNRMFLAAGKEILCCSLDLGEVLWRRPIDDLKGLVSLHPTGSSLLVLSHGWKYTGYRLQPSRSVTLDVLEPSTGGILRSVRWDSSEERSMLRHARMEKALLPKTVLDAWGRREGMLLLQPSALRALSTTLEPLGELLSREEYGDFLSATMHRDGVTLRTTKGLLMLSDIPDLGVSWWRPLPAPLMHDGKRLRQVGEMMGERGLLVETEHAWIAPAMSWEEMSQIEATRVLHEGDFALGDAFCTRTGSGFSCLDVRSGEVLLEVSDPHAWRTSLFASGWFLSRGEDWINVARLEGPAVKTDP